MRAARPRKQFRKGRSGPNFRRRRIARNAALDATQRTKLTRPQPLRAGIFFGLVSSLLHANIETSRAGRSMVFRDQYGTTRPVLTWGVVKRMFQVGTALNCAETRFVVGGLK